MWFISELHEMIRVSDLVGCPMVFILLCHLGRVGGQRKLMKKFCFFCDLDPHRGVLKLLKNYHF